MFKQISTVEFPEYDGNININMMPIIFGEINSIPKKFHKYLLLIEKCDLKDGDLAYLTIHESFVPKGKTQRRPGIHTDGTSGCKWGGGNWGKGGIFMASSDGSCKVWNSTTYEVDDHGSLLFQPSGISKILKPNTLYQLSDRTPHQSLPVDRDTNRQFFRLVSKDVELWWAQHSTPNPLGIEPDCKILTHSKFEGE